MVNCQWMHARGRAFALTRPRSIMYHPGMGERAGNADQRVLCEIANFAFGSVGELLETDRAQAGRLRARGGTSHQVIGEETITELLVTRLATRFPDRVRIRLFTRHEESRNGADWYWRVEKPGGAIHARVQAKRVRRSEFGQADGDGTVDIDQVQLARLIATADSDVRGLPNLQAWLATYGRFSANPPCGSDPCYCDRHGCDGYCDESALPSIWIGQAKDFVGEPSSRHRLVDIVRNSVRLDCVLPCLDSRDGGSGAKGLKLTVGLPSFETCVSEIQADPALLGSFAGAMVVSI